MIKRPRNHPRKDWFHKPKEERRRWSFLDEVKPAFNSFPWDASSVELLFNGKRFDNRKYWSLDSETRGSKVVSLQCSFSREVVP